MKGLSNLLVFMQVYDKIRRQDDKIISQYLILEEEYLVLEILIRFLQIKVLTHHKVNTGKKFRFHSSTLSDILRETKCPYIIRSLLPNNFDEAAVAVILRNPFKNAVVTPIHKKISKTVVKHYFPDSVLPNWLM